MKYSQLSPESYSQAILSLATYIREFIDTLFLIETIKVFIETENVIKIFFVIVVYSLDFLKPVQVTVLPAETKSHSSFGVDKNSSADRRLSTAKWDL